MEEMTACIQQSETEAIFICLYMHEPGDEVRWKKPSVCPCSFHFSRIRKDLRDPVGRFRIAVQCGESWFVRESSDASSLERSSSMSSS